MRKKIIILSVFLTAVFLLSSCDDITRNFNIFSIFSAEKTPEEKLDTASYYLAKGSKTGYNKAMEIYQEILAEDEYNSDACYGYATAYARYNEIDKSVVGVIPQIMGLMADLQSADPVVLFERLYSSREEVREKQLASYNISKTVSETLLGLAMDKGNEPRLYHGKVKSEDIWLDAAFAYIYRCGSTISTHDGTAEEATVFELEWDPIEQVIEISTEGLLAWATKEIEEQTAIIDASTESLSNAMLIIALHTGAEELGGLADELDKVNGYFDELIGYLETIE